MHEQDTPASRNLAGSGGIFLGPRTHVSVRGTAALAQWQGCVPTLPVYGTLVYLYSAVVVLQRLQEAIHRQGGNDFRGLRTGHGQVDDCRLDACQLQERD